jgi:diadenylate cyclase
MHGIALGSLTRWLRWQDAVDVLLLTLLFSSAYRWLRRTLAVQVALGLMTLLAGSWLANYVGLILTSYLLSAVGAVATIIVVVVFQHEIRQGLSRVSPLRWLSNRHERPGPLDTSETIARAAFSVAKHMKGALIVIPRRDSLLDRVTAGTMIDARLSAPMIEAIFTSMSPLHDGAVVVGADRILRAGVVLPLSTESDDTSHGTRHRAARGLAQITDALVVCVSEEHGTVSLAQDDRLDAMADEAQLSEALRRLCTENVRRTRKGSPLPSLRSVVPHLAIFACVVAAWAALALDRSHVVTKIVPLEIRGIADGLTFDPPRYTSVALELRSSRREIDQLSPKAVGAYVDLSKTTLGSHVFRVAADAPAGIEVVNSTPITVELRIQARPAPGAGLQPSPREVTATPDPQRRAQSAPHR